MAPLNSSARSSSASISMWCGLSAMALTLSLSLLPTVTQAESGDSSSSTAGTTFAGICASVWSTICTLFEPVTCFVSSNVWKVLFFLEGVLPAPLTISVKGLYATLPPFEPIFILYTFLTYAALMIIYRTYEAKRVIRVPSLKGFSTHAAEAMKVHSQFQTYLQNRKEGEKVSINRSKGGHDDSNRTIAADYKKLARRVDVSALDGVIAIDEEKHLMHIEPGLPMDELARIAIAYGWVPEVVLEFPGITAGGALCGGGIESTSHSAGSFYDTVAEVDIITGDGEFRKSVSKTNEPDLFAALATSYGTHGILTRIAVRIERAPRFVHVRYIHAAGMDGATAAMTGAANEHRPPMFIDGVAMSETSAMVVLGDGCDQPPQNVPYTSLRQKRSDPWFFWHLTDLARSMPIVPFSKAPSSPRQGWRGDASREEYMTLDDYLFRFDRGAFWMARHGLYVFYRNFAYNPSPLSSAGPSLILRFKYAWLATTRQLYRMLHAIGDEGLARTYIVQDYIMPGAAEAGALSKFTADVPENKIGIWPLWICPVRMVAPRHRSNAGFGFPVQATPSGGLMFNVGVYGLPNNGNPFDPVEVNKGLEEEATRLGGRKMLYAQSFYSKQEFWQLFDRAAYDRVRKSYGGAEAFPDIDSKLLLGSRMESMRGEQPISFARCAGAMALWYFSLWQEMLLPRFLHKRLNINFTGMTRYASAPEGAAAASVKGLGAGGSKRGREVVAAAPSKAGGARVRSASAGAKQKTK